MSYVFLLILLFPVKIIRKLFRKDTGKNLVIQTAKIGDFINATPLLAYLQKSDVLISRSVGALAGFFLTEPGMAGTLPVREFSDFFILQKYRRRGLALEVVRRVLLGSEQTWMVATFRADAAACAFWRQAFARLPFARVEAYDDPDLPQFQLTLLKPAA